MTAPDDTGFHRVPRVLHGRVLLQETTSGTGGDTLAEFVARHTEVIGYAMSPDEAYWFRHSSDGLERMGPDDTEQLDIGNAFELRAFCSDAELRWRFRGDGRSSAIVLSEEARTEGRPESPMRLQADGAKRLLWGLVVDQPHPGWTRLADSRVGTYAVPFGAAATAGSRLALELVEYVSRDEHGNVSVVDERALGIGPAKESR